MRKKILFIILGIIIAGGINYSIVWAKEEIASSHLKKIVPLRSGVPDSFVLEKDKEDYGKEDIDREEKSIDEEGVSGEEKRISLDLKGVDVTDFFKVLSIKTNKTIVPSKNLTGRITIFLNNVTFQDALDIILVSQGFAVEKKRDIVFVMTKEEYKNLYGREYDEKRQLKSFKLKYSNPENVFSTLNEIKSDIGKVIIDKTTGYILLFDIPKNLSLMAEAIEELDQPLETAVFDLNYSKTEDLKTSLSSIMTPNAGKVVVDERSSKVFISDLPEKMKKIKEVVDSFDEKSRQVFIEVEILEITLTDQFQRGINWEKLFNQKNFDGLDFKGYFPLTLTSYGDMSVGTLGVDGYRSVLQFLQYNTDVKILSRPRISVLNNEEAKIHVGSREAYVSQTQSQAEATTVTAEAVEFINVGVQLDVVPTINKEGFITMKIKPEVSSVRATLTTALDSEIPIVDTAEAETVVKVKDGVTIMLGGLMKEDRRDTEYGNPYLSRLPLIGMLFGNRNKIVTKTETVIFITPHLSDGETTMTGTEPEKRIPGEIMPEDLRDSIILKEMEKIKLDTVPGAVSGTAGMLSLNKRKDDLTAVILQEKIKGLKN